MKFTFLQQPRYFLNQSVLASFFPKLFTKWFYLLHIDFPEQDGTQYHGGNLGQGNGVPYGV